MQAQMETGMPYMIYNTLGRINSNAHVCVEIIEHTSPGEFQFSINPQLQSMKPTEIKEAQQESR